MAHDLFLSYSSQDKLIATRLCDAIEQAGFPCWLAPRDVLPGRDWSEEIIDALNASRAIVLLFSAHSNSSPQVLREIERGINKRLPILVFRIEDVPLSKGMEYFLSVPHWFDALTPPLESHFGLLIQALGRLLGPRATTKPLAEADLTFLFTDIEGSTRLWERSPQEMQRALQQHDRLLQETITHQRGTVFKTVGDAFCAVFAQPEQAVAAALALQQALCGATPLPVLGEPLRVRIAVHTGPAEARDQDYFGPTLNRVARLLALAHGGQVILSQAASRGVSMQLPEGATLLGLGVHPLKDLQDPEEIYQLCHTSIPAEFPPLGRAPSRFQRLPLPSLPLLGREQELQEVLALLQKTRLVTLTGIGGTGKTRLALEIAQQLQQSSAYELGLFIPMDEETKPERLWPLLAQQLTRLGIALPSPLPGSGEEDTARRVLGALAQRSALVLLDNLEQLEERALQRVLRPLLEQTERVRLLVTSQRRLNLREEQVYPLAPLSVQAALGEESAGVRLFVERARLLRPEFSVAPEVLTVIATLCQRLDGLPLAIEMAAARTSVLSPAQILERLESRTDLLVSRRKDVPARHLSLRAALEWSFELLSPTAQRFLCEASVFRGGWTLDAAEQVCTVDALEATEELEEASLLLTQEGEASTRYRLLEVVRAFARTRLSPEESHALHQRHADWYGSDGVRGERENLLAAMAFLRESRQEERLAKLLHQQLGYWWAHSGFDEAREQLIGYLTLCREKGVRGKAPLVLLTHLLHLELYQQRLGSATEWLERAGDFATEDERAGDPSWLLALAHWTEKQGDFAEALVLHAQCEARQDSPGDLRVYAHLSQLWLYLRLGEAERARQLSLAALPPALEAALSQDSEATRTFLRASALTRLGELVSARQELDRSLALLVPLNHDAVLQIARSIEAEWFLAAGKVHDAWETGLACLLPLWYQRDMGRLLATLDLLSQAAERLAAHTTAEECLRLSHALEEGLAFQRTPAERGRLAALHSAQEPLVPLSQLEARLQALAAESLGRVH